MTVLCLFWFFLSVFSVAVTQASDEPQPAQLRLFLIDTNQYPNALCNDGSQSGFYFKPAISQKANSIWLVHLMGGHWCWDINTCNQRWQNDSYLMSSKQWPKIVTKTGIFDENPLLNPLHNVNKVFVGYCSSDAWMGDRPASSDTGGWHFRGQKIIEAVLNTLQSSNNNDKFGMNSSQGASTLIWSGCSAGGRGAMVNLDYIPGILQDSQIQVLGILDSPVWADIQPYYPLKQISLKSQTKQVFNFANATARVKGCECGIVYSEKSEMWKCLFGQYKLPLMMSDDSPPFLVNGALYDSFQLLWNTDQTDLEDYTPTMENYAEDPFRKTVESIVEGLSKNVVSAACYHHCTSEEIYYWNITVHGQSFATATQRFLINQGVLEVPMPDSHDHSGTKGVISRESTNKWIGNCTGGVNCGDGCASSSDPY